MNRRQVEAQSRRNARLIIKGKDNLKSWGKSGSIYLPRLKKYMKYRSNLERNTFLAVDKISDIVCGNYFRNNSSLSHTKSSLLNDEFSF